MHMHTTMHTHNCAHTHTHKHTHTHTHLAEHVAGRKGHVLQCRWVPCGEQQPSVVGVDFDASNQVCELVYTLTWHEGYTRGGEGRKR
jgi:hypothetical protein